MTALPGWQIFGRFDCNRAHLSDGQKSAPTRGTPAFLQDFTGHLVNLPTLGKKLPGSLKLCQGVHTIAFADVRLDGTAVECKTLGRGQINLTMDASCRPFKDAPPCSTRRELAEAVMVHGLTALVLACIGMHMAQPKGVHAGVHLPQRGTQCDPDPNPQLQRLQQQ